MVRVQKACAAVDSLATITSAEEMEHAVGERAELIAGDPELTFWAAVELRRVGLTGNAAVLFERAFAAGDCWRRLYDRLPG